jgi:hypothetical protein
MLVFAASATAVQHANPRNRETENTKITAVRTVRTANNQQQQQRKQLQTTLKSVYLLQLFCTEYTHYSNQ